MPSATGIFNLMMAQDPCVAEYFGPIDHVIDDADRPNRLVLNIDSIGEADLNVDHRHQ